MKKYQTLYRRIVEEIRGGVLLAGQRLTSIREESKMSGISINTVIAAYELLETDGYLFTKERGGYYVRHLSAEKLAQNIPEDEQSTKQYSYTAASEVAGDRLEQLYDRLVAINPRFATAVPGKHLLPQRILSKLAKSIGTSWIEYDALEGDWNLRRRLAAARIDVDGEIDPGGILITNGATEALSIVIRSILKPGDRVIIESPSYLNFFRQLKPANVELIEIPLTRDGIDLNILEDEMNAGPVKLVLIQANVQNPLGITMGIETKRRLVEIVSRHGSYLIQDDVYGDLFFGSVRPANIGSFSDYENFILISSFSKSIAPGLRMGWLYSQRHIRRFSDEKNRLSMESNRLSQRILTDFIGTTDHKRYLKQIRSRLYAQMDTYISELANVVPEGTHIRKPSGGCLLWIQYPESVNAHEVFHRAAQKGLVVAPGSLFTASEKFSNCLRINTGTPLDDQAIEQLRLLGL